MERRRRVSALRVLSIVALSIFLSEFLVMIILSFLPPLPVWAEALLDSHMLIIMVLPLLYIFLFRPFSRQIEERVDAEFHLVSERDRVQKYLDVAGVMLVVIEKNERVSLINKRGLEILGLGETEVVGYNWFDNFLPERCREEAREIFTILYSERPARVEYYENPVLTRNGEERIVAWHNTVLKNPDGETSAILSSGEDITERREAEDSLHEAHQELELRVEERTRELKEAKENLEREFLEHKIADEALEETELRFESVTDTANEAIVAADHLDKIVSWNRGAQKIFGYKEEEVIGKDLTIIIPERYRKAHEKGVERFLDTGRSSVLGKTLELEGLRKDGGEFPLELSLATWKTGKGTFFSGIMRDITVRKRIEEEKENIQAQLLHSQKLEAVGRLIVGVAHDFSNIILSIKGYSSRTMKELEKAGPLHENMEKILLLVDRGSKLTQQLLLFGKKEPPEFTEVDMNSTVDGLLSMIDNLIRSDIVVTAVLDPMLWRVRADRGNIEQLLMNLVVNANDAMPEGGELLIKTANVEFDDLTSKTVTEAEPGRYVMVSVTDTGIGMEKGVAERIFDPFFTTKGKEGSGLGLSVIYGIANRHGGWINVESKPGQGASFTFYIPAISVKGARRKKAAGKKPGAKGSD